MRTSVSPVKLFDALRSKFETTWLNPRDMASQVPLEIDWINNPSLINHFNPVRPSSVQVFGPDELARLPSVVDSPERLSQAIPENTLGLVFCQSAPPPMLDEWCKEARKNLAIFSVDAHADFVVSYLYESFAHAIASKVTMHGVFLGVLNQGVMITGAPAIGKSEIALEMLGRGHSFVADDLVEFSRVGYDQVVGSCPEIIREMIEVRSLGIVNVRQLFGNHVILLRQKLDFIVILFSGDSKLIETDRSRPLEIEPQRILGVDIPVYPIQVRPGRNLAVIIETCARVHIMRRESQYDAVAEIIERQERCLE